MISRISISGAYPTKRLGDVVEFLDNMRRPITESDRRAGPYPYYGANGQQGTIDDFIFDEPLVLLAEDGGHFGTPDRGIAYRISGKTWVNNHAHVLRPKAGMDLAFLCRVLENYDVTSFVTGTTRGKLTQAGASEIVVPVPPLPEQRRIAEVLDRADALRAKRRAALAQLDALTQALFLDLFGDPATNPKKWPTTALQDVATTTSGGTPNRAVPEYFGGGIPWVKSGELHESILTSTEESLTERGIAESSARVMPAGTVLVAMYGATVGAIATLGIAAATNQAVCCLQLGDNINTAFLVHLLKRLTPSLLTKRVGGAQPNLSQELIRSIRIPLPPLDLQRDFARRVAGVEKLNTAHRASLAELEGLFGTLQHRAFRGEL